MYIKIKSIPYDIYNLFRKLLMYIYNFLNVNVKIYNHKIYYHLKNNYKKIHCIYTYAKHLSLKIYKKSKIGTRTIPIVETINVINSGTSSFTATGNIISNGNSPITDMGFIYYKDSDGQGNIVSVTPITQNGQYATTISSNSNTHSYVIVSTYATNVNGTSYGNSVPILIDMCLAEGTLITLHDMTTKPIEFITYKDVLLVWDFDKCKLSSSKPLWIKIKESANKYNLLEFDNGSKLSTINQHRIFNEEAGKFTYPMTNDTPIGTTTYSLSGKTKLINKSVICANVNHYNIITEKHINLFANGILTSCRYNNSRNIKNMKFISPESHNSSEIPLSVKNIPWKYINGLRLNEQHSISIESSIEYINNLMTKDAGF